MSVSHKKYLALRQSPNDADCDLYTAPEEKSDFQTINKARKFQLSTICLGTTTILLFAIVAIQALLLVRSGQRSLSKGRINSDQKRLLD